jgi:diadenylate cyclase
MTFLAILQDFRFQDLLDILFLTVFSYHLFLWFRGTKAFKALVGLLVFGVVFTAARVWGLFLTTWVFQILWQVLVLLLIILFQREIRQVLERVNPLRSFGLHRLGAPGAWSQGLAEGVFWLASKRTGALIILERTDAVEELITEGHLLEADPTSELLMSVFQKDSPLHDGAMLIRGGRVSQVACYLPLTSETGLPKQWGTRHRAALGLTERCDAWVLVVSEERGEVSLARGGEMVRAEGKEDLVRLIREAFEPSRPGIPRREQVRLLVTRRWRVKTAVFGVVCVVWLALAGQQDFEVTLDVPLVVQDIPPGRNLVEPVNPRVRIQVQGLRKDASILNEKNVQAVVDASGVSGDRGVARITRSDIQLPNERVRVVKIDPARIELVFQKTP